MLSEVTFAVIGLLFLFSDIRTWTSAFQLTFFGYTNTQLAIMAGAVFATSFLAPLVGWRIGPRRSTALCGAILGITTLLATLSRNNLTDLSVTTVALAVGMWWLGLLHASRAPDRPSPLPVALPIAFVADVALRAAFRTIPVVDAPLTVAGPLVLVAALVFFAAGISALSGPRQWTRPGLLGAIGLVAIPPLIFVAETSGTNGAQVALASGLGLGPEPSRATQLGTVLVGLGLAAGSLALTRGFSRGIVAAIGCAIGAALVWAHVPTISLLGGLALAAGVVAAGATLPAGALVPGRSPLVVTLALAVGWIAFLAAAFGFYAFWAYEPAAWAATAVVVVAALVNMRVAVPPWRALALVLAPVAILVPVASLWLTPPGPAPEPARATFRLMTYNVHQGFNAAQIPSLDELADTIAHESPDVLLLQEVVRGWMIDEQHDALSVLSERLAMPYVFGPNIGDLYGNAILSRYPITDVRRIHFAPQPALKHQPRGALFVHIGDLLIINTHLDQFSDASAIRQEQVRTILREWDGEKLAILAGDLNATPETIEIALIDQAGFGDLAGSAGPTTIGDDPPKRIDYIWGVGVFASSAHILNAPNASDHRALVVNVMRQNAP